MPGVQSRVHREVSGRGFLGLLVSVVTLLVLTGCSSTTFVSTWQSPDIPFGALDGERVAVFFISDSETSRRATENALVRELDERGAEGLAGYTLLTAEEAQDEEAARARLVEEEADAVLTLRVISEEERITETPDTWVQVPYYRSWGRYWERSWYTVRQPGTTRTDTIVRVEILIYEMESGELIWASLSDTTNPDDIDSFVQELARAVDGEMEKSKLLS
ncbi:MAG: hypothetical protein AAGD01_02705 [Acidobacteriota bacterium]